MNQKYNAIGMSRRSAAAATKKATTRPWVLALSGASAASATVEESTVCPEGGTVIDKLGFYTERNAAAQRSGGSLCRARGDPKTMAKLRSESFPSESCRQTKGQSCFEHDSPTLVPEANGGPSGHRYLNAGRFGTAFRGAARAV